MTINVILLVVVFSLGVILRWRLSKPVKVYRPTIEVSLILLTAAMVALTGIRMVLAGVAKVPPFDGGWISLSVAGLGFAMKDIVTLFGMLRDHLKGDTKPAKQ